MNSTRKDDAHHLMLGPKTCILLVVTTLLLLALTNRLAIVVWMKRTIPIRSRGKEMTRNLERKVGCDLLLDRDVNALVKNLQRVAGIFCAAKNAHKECSEFLHFFSKRQEPHLHIVIQDPVQRNP